MKFGNVVIFWVVGALASIFSTRPDLFALTRGDVVNGEMWRLVTGHFVHFSRNHLLLNLGAVGLLLPLLPKLSRWQFIWLLVVAPVAISGLLLFTRPQLEMYGGLSGWLSGTFVFVAFMQLSGKSWTKYVYLVGLMLFAAKIVIELGTHNSLFITLGKGVVVEPAAHVIGAVTGALGVLFGSLTHAGKGIDKEALGVGNKKAVPGGTA